MNKELVYVCSPLSAKTPEGIKANMQKAKEYTRIVSEIFNCRAIAPHSFLPEYLDDAVPEERSLAIRFGQDLIKLCSKVVVCGNVISSGMKSEIDLAKKLGIPVIQLAEKKKPSVRIAVAWIEGEEL